MTKNKTLATWLTFLGGPFGLHRFYLFSFTDRLGWILPIPTLLGLYGVQRAREHGLDDPLGWLLIPLLGFTMAGCAINAIVYGLMASPAWNARFNPHATRSLGGPHQLVHDRSGGARLVGGRYGADQQHRVQLPALLRVSDRGVAQTLAMTRWPPGPPSERSQNNCRLTQ